MTDEQKAAFIIAQSAVLVARVAGMQAENQIREHRGESLAYAENAFLTLIDESGVHHNAAIGLFHDWK